MSVTNNIIAKEPKLEKEWDYEKNYPVKPEEVLAGSSKKYWWICKINPNHKWQSSPIARTGKKKQGCGKCTRNFNKSRTLSKLYPEIAKLWHPTKNKDVLPSDVKSRSGLEF